MRTLSFWCACLLMVSGAAGQSIPRPPRGFDTAWMDNTANPCTDFYQYACGTWLAKNPIPPDQSRWGRFNELEERNLAILREILETSAVPQPNRTPIEQKIGDYYASCMDEKAINAKGLAPLKPELDRISALKDKKNLAAVVAHLHRIGVRALFGFGSDPDYKNSKWMIAVAAQGGLSLPDRDYYLKTDPKSVELRQQYEKHVQAMFHLLGDSEAEASRRANVVLDFETGLAKSSLDRVTRRNPEKIYHKMTAKELEALNPSFSWPRYFQGVKAPSFQSLNVAEPDFFRGVEQQLQSQSLDNWRTYLTWRLLHSSAPLLPAPFVEENFNFYGKILTGAKELRPRWKRCVSMVDDELGEALGRKYVEKTFGAGSKERMLKLVDAIERALAEDLKSLDWMTPATKQRALEKLHAVTNKIGYPDKWRDYSSVRIVRGDALGNSIRASEFEVGYELAKIGKRVDPKEWFMTPPTVNAYYNPTMNNINFPAGILQPPFFDNKMDDAVNYGGIGAVIGHELTHGFDDQGRKFDGQGNLRDWWTPRDAQQFEKRAQCFVDQYSGYTAVDSVKLNGKLTLGENVADNGGLRLAYMALMDILGGKQPPKIDGFTAAQRFFLGWGQIWCQNITSEGARLRATIDPHSPGEYRVNGVVSNMPEFREAFGCREGQPMVREKACRVW
jgi:putative endopeptidase